MKKKVSAGTWFLGISLKHPSEGRLPGEDERHEETLAKPANDKIM
jgi:hypothetical protein